MFGDADDDKCKEFIEHVIIPQSALGDWKTILSCALPNIDFGFCSNNLLEI